MEADPTVRRLGAALGVDAPALLHERVAVDGDRATATRLLPTSDGWVAVSLARADDVELVPAWVGTSSLEEGLAAMTAAHAVERGRLLGLPVSTPGERAPGDLYHCTSLGQAPPLRRAPLVVDLSSLWAGPLCTRLLRERGATVIKVESSSRPDGARSGSPAFFEILNAGKECVRVDFTAAELLPLLRSADVVVEGSRPRALEQLGIDAAALVREGPRVWLSVTGHGRTSPQRDWVAFGDDAAVAGGLVRWDEGVPHLVGDAVADPLTGMAAAVAVLDLLARGGRWLVDCNLAGVAAHVAGAA
ncbi:MAG: hypothetical protein QOJ09_2649 [Actinomycetota bacterium]|jgi:hypothetical protein|nr:hypothetical protein [Actinomycetota bacterium]